MKKKNLALSLIGISLLANQFMTNNYTVVNNEIKLSTGPKIVDLNPETGELCVFETGSYAGDTNENKTGCLRWMVYNSDDDSYDMILDHNTTNFANTTDINSALQNDTKTWLKELNPRFLTWDEMNSSGEFISSLTNNLYDDVNSYLYCEENGAGCVFTSYIVPTNLNNPLEKFYTVVGDSIYYNETYTDDLGALAIRPVITVQKCVVDNEEKCTINKIDKSNNISLSAGDKSIISRSTELKTTVITEKDESYSLVKKYLKNIENAKLYDINLYENGSKIQPNGNVTLTFEVGSMDINKVKVYRINDDDTYTLLESKIVDGKIEVTTNHFSTYVLTEEEMSIQESKTEIEEEDQIENPNTGDNIKYVFVSLGLVLGGITLCGYKLKKKYN